MKIINKLLITLIAITSIFNFMILDNYNIYAEKNNTYKVDPYTQESVEYINELKGNIVKKSTSNQMYNDIYQAMINLEDSVDLSSYGPPNSTDVFNIRKKVLDDHPEIFYFKHEGSGYWSNGKLEFKYIDSKSVVKNMISELDTKVDMILNKYIDKSMSQMEKLIAIHDYIVLNTTYLETTYCYDSYGVIVKGRGVCQGYAESMKLLLNRIGIDCIYVSSPAMNHGWNIVNIDGKNYHLDATWDDPVPNREGAVRYMYLALSDSEMSKDHNWDRSQYPICNSDEYKYMREMDYVVNGINNRYYTNIEDNWNIYEIKKDGTNKEKIVNEAATPLYIKDGYLYYKEYFSGETKKIFINKEDINKDGVVDVLDLSLVALSYNTTAKDDNWNSGADINKDGMVDIFDLVLVSKKME